MNETLKTEENIRQYLLGRVTDDARLAEYEELLFSDNEFCELVEVTEDALTNDHVFGRLSASDETDFVKTLENNSERRSKVALTRALKVKAAEQRVAIAESSPAFFESLRIFFSQPMYAGGFALLLIAAVVGSFLLFRSSQTDELANLKEVYEKERSVEPRIAGFDYAPLVATRGETEEREKNKLRRIENELILGTENSPSASTHRALGVFYLTQRKFDDAIAELEKAAKLDKSNAVILNDLGSAYFEKSKTEPQEKKLEILARALENFSQAVNSNPDLLEALFNKALCLQELRLDNQAKQAWTDYLEKDKTSAWATEARKNLERLEQTKSSAKTKEQVLDDFLDAYRRLDKETVWKLNSQTKEMISGVWLPDQLTRKFLEAKIRGDDVGASEFIKAMTYIGDLEKENNADFFVADLADFYSKSSSSKHRELLLAKDLQDQGMELLVAKNWALGTEKLHAARSIFDRLGNFPDLEMARFWIAFYNRNVSKLNESQREYSTLLAYCETNNYRSLSARILSVQGENEYKLNNLSKAVTTAKKSLAYAERSNDVLLVQKNSTNLGDIYQTMGEMGLASNYFSKSIFTQNLYFESNLQKLRNLWYSAMMLRDQNLPFSAVSFGEEALSIAKSQNDNKSLVFDTTVDLGISHTVIKNFQRSAELAEENLNLATSFDDADGKDFALIESNLQMAHIYRLVNKCEKAIEHYDIAVNGLEKLSEFQTENFNTHKGRLVCYKNLNRKTDFENEHQIANKLFERYRNEISEEENRNAFFNREQNFSDITAEYYLAQNQHKSSLEFFEASKARSLLDLLEGNGSYDAKTGQIRFGKTSKPLGFDEIQKRLPSSVQFLKYAVFETKLVIWLIANDRFETKEVNISANDLDRKIEDWLAKMSVRSPEVNLAAKDLYDLLIRPTVANLDKNKRLCFVPDGVLYQMPFAALVTEQDKYLIEDFALYYAPSLTTSIVLTEKAKQKPEAENLFAVGNPKFDAQVNPSLQDLSSAENEVTSIAKLYSEKQLLTGHEAVKNRVIAGLKKASIFHFAGHYLINPSANLYSKLLLTKVHDPASEFEGELPAFEILQAKYPNLKLAVLSACDTGIERVYDGEGAIGMARTFLASGVPLVIASQWKVESESTSDLMTAFHRNRTFAKLSSTDSLRQAQIEMINSQQYGHPYFWSAFSAVGGAAEY